MTSNESLTRQQLESMLDMASTHLNQSLYEPKNDTADYRRALTRARLAQTIFVRIQEEANKREGLEDIITGANRQLPVTLVAQARANYEIGYSRYGEQDSLDADAENDLKSSFEQYTTANNALDKFARYFKTQEEQIDLQQWKEHIFRGWCNAALLLGSDAQNKGLHAISGKHPTMIPEEAGLNCLNFWDVALSYYTAIVKLAEAAKAFGIDMDEYTSVVNPNIEQIKRDAPRLARLVGDTERAAKYLQ